MSKRDGENGFDPKVEPFDPDGGSAEDLVNSAYADTFQAFRSLEEAKSFPDAVLVLEGNYGGQIYLVCPASLVGCGEDEIRALLEEIDTECAKNPQGARVLYRIRPQGAVVAGGMGGGKVLGDVWVHQDVRALGLEQKIRRVLLGDG